MPLDLSINSVLIIGSGPIVIGQACEFDYSGTQAANSIREEGIRLVLINSNPATIMTDPITADKVYLLPLTRDSIEKILKEEQIDAVLPTMGGQTALNLFMECEKAGLWKKYNVKPIGVDFHAINTAEDRESFRQLMHQMEIDIPKAGIVRSFLEGKKYAKELGFPLVIRASYTLGGKGAKFVQKEEGFDQALTNALHASPIHEAMIDESIFGWKEYELEVMRDLKGNFIVICAIENFDPCGIHTGDSVTVAPPMTLPDTDLQRMRDIAKRILEELGSFAGGCNVQFAINPEDGRIVVIEINPRVSRSSALASKATGYPIARVAAKLALGYSLDELPNQITETTSAFFEPSLDYVVVKIPRWNFNKFPGADRQLGLQMKSVGEVMSIGRTFNEALQKAAQSLEINRNGLGADTRGLKKSEKILESLENPSWDRIFHIRDAIKSGISVNTIQKITKIDKWFLKEIQKIVEIEEQLSEFSIDNLPENLLTQAKQNGFGDRQIAHLIGTLESQVYKLRKSLNINRVYKRVDTCAAEFEAKTPYLYSTIEQENESEISDKKKIIILGSGPNRIGQGIEFDYSCVHGILAAKEEGFEAIMINCNPETVSTDFNVADKLYFEPVFWEYVYEIIEHEKPDGVIVQLGGQTALKLAEKLTKYDIPIVGTSFESLDTAEDRGCFSNLLRRLEIPFPEYGVARNADDAIEIVKKTGFPVLVRPSYVLGGHKMRIVINERDLENHVVDLLTEMPENQILVDYFLEGAIEVECDAICDGEEVHILGIMEHIEPAGIHSGDSSAVLPAFDLSQDELNKLEEYTKRIALELNVIGLINIQFAVKDGVVYVIEANPRASRTVPFIAKAYQVPYVNIATKVMLRTKKLKDFDIQPVKKGYAIKIPIFSFDKFPNVNKELGPEMKSTGEEIVFIDDLYDKFFMEKYSERNLYLSR